MQKKLSYRAFVRPQRQGWVGIHISLQLLVPAGITQDPIMILLPSVQLIYMFLVRLPLWFSINRLRNVKDNMLSFATVVLGPVAIFLTVVFAIQTLEFAPSLLLNQVTPEAITIRDEILPESFVDVKDSCCLSCFFFFSPFFRPPCNTGRDCTVQYSMGLAARCR